MENDGMEKGKPENSPSVIFKPGSGRALAFGWTAMKRNFLLFLLVEIFCGMILSPLFVGGEPNNGSYGDSYYSGSSSSSSAFFGFFMFAYWLLLVPIIEYGASFVYLKGTRGDKVEIDNLLSGFKNYINVILASLLVFGLIGIGMMVFIIPGIYIACRLAFVSYLVMDEGLDPVAAVEGSWRITRGHTWKIFCLSIMSILIFIIGFLLLFVGTLPAAMWAKASFAALYLSITEQGHQLIEDNPNESKENGINKPLVIGAVSIVLIVALGLFWSIKDNVISGVLSDPETRTLSLDASNINQLNIDGDAGFVIIRGREGINQIQVNAAIEAYLGELELTLEADNNEATLVAKVNQANRVNWNNLGKIDLTIEVPSKINIIADTAYGPMTVSNIIGNVNLDSGYGKIRVNDITGSLIIDTGSGSVEARDITHNLYIDTGSGRVTTANIGNDLIIDTGSGRIEVDTVGGNVHVDTGSGGINIVSVQGNVVLDTGSGSITVDQIGGELHVDQGSGSLNVSNVSGPLVID